MDLTGLPAFVDGLASFLQSQGVNATVALGWRLAGQQVAEGDGPTMRIVVQPGTPNGDAGELAEPRQAGYGPRAVWPPPPASGSGAQSPDDIVGRELNDWAEAATVYLWAVDTEAPDDERRQYIAVRALLQWFRVAAQYVGRASVDVGALEWVNIENAERQYGRELRLAVVVHAPLFDLTPELRHPAAVSVTGQFSTTT